MQWLDVTNAKHSNPLVLCVLGCCFITLNHISSIFRFAQKHRAHFKPNFDSTPHFTWIREKTVSSSSCFNRLWLQPWSLSVVYCLLRPATFVWYNSSKKHISDSIFWNQFQIIILINLFFLFPVQINHFRYQNGLGTFLQRVVVDKRFYRGNGYPVFFYPVNEGQWEECKWNNPFEMLISISEMF